MKKRIVIEFGHYGEIDLKHQIHSWGDSWHADKKKCHGGN